MKKKTPTLSIAVLLLLAALYAWEHRDAWLPNEKGAPPPAGRDPGANEGRIEQAFREKRKKVWVEASGMVTRVLPEDRIPPRHQRFLVRLPSGHTVKLAHNVDLAPPVAGLRAGQRITFRGRYEYEARGGVVHWTHHDPDGRGRGGWLEIEGKRYE